MNKHSETVVVVGATSDIARATALELARHYNLILAGRDDTELGIISQDIATRRECHITTLKFEALSSENHAEFIEDCFTKAGKIAGTVVCHGFLPEQVQAQRDWDLARKTLDVNFTSCVSLLEPFMERLESQGHGFIAVISSVAGDRGRQSNYLYGAAKGGLSVYLQGLRNRGKHTGVHVMTVKPGFVATEMTVGLVDPKSPLVAQPQQVAKDIVRGIKKQRNVIYSRWFWRYIMLIIRSIPERIFKRLRL
ncbi:MAG: short-chain dehydrogenase [Planctomycetaceae bacterium]|nr:short-chain dehydrogenase [Planctomycetaceae bacterium]